MTDRASQKAHGRATPGAAAGGTPADDAAPWSAKVGEKRGDIVTAWERGDKGNVVYLRWTSPETGTYEKLATGIRLRDKSGKRVKARIAEVMKLAEAKQAELRVARAGAALMPGGVGADRRRQPTTQPRTSPETQISGRETDVKPARLRLSAGVERAMTIRTGMFAVENGHTRDTRAALARALTVLDPQLTFDELTSQHFCELWRELAYRYQQEREDIEVARREALDAGSEHGGPTRAVGGRVATERAVIALVRVARWLNDGGHVTSGAIRPPLNWKKALVTDWMQITGESPRDDEEQPRYTLEELGRLHLSLPKSDPRLQLAVELAGEARLGPVVGRSRRSDMNLRDGAGALGLGQLRVRGAGTKPGVVIDFDTAQRAHVDAVLGSGHLSELEALYRSGTVSDYWLFPGGRLVKGKARTDVRVPMNDRTVNDLWRELEDLAGVAHVAGRGPYGMRRVATDLAEDIEPDERALRALFGHTAPDTRGRVYQKKERVETAQKTTSARRRLRELSMESARRAEQERDASTSGTSGDPREAADVAPT